MQYKTIVLELLQDQTELYEQLRSSKRLLPAMDAYAIDLRNCHLARQEALAHLRPFSEPVQIRAEALELAIGDLQERLLSASPKDEADPTQGVAPMSIPGRHTPLA